MTESLLYQLYIAILTYQGGTVSLRRIIDAATQAECEEFWLTVHLREPEHVTEIDTVMPALESANVTVPYQVDFSDPVPVEPEPTDPQQE